MSTRTGPEQFADVRVGTLSLGRLYDAVAPGPRLRPEWRSVEPGVADSSASGSVTAVAAANTVTITTLTLVLVAIIVILQVT